MRDLTKKLVRLVLDTDDSVTEEHRLQILRGLSERPASPAKLITRKQAAEILGVGAESEPRIFFFSLQMRSSNCDIVLVPFFG